MNVNPFHMYSPIRFYVAAFGIALATALSAQNPGQTDQLSVMEAQGVVPTTVRASDSFETYGPHYMNDIIAAYPAVMGASDWNWSFKNTNGNELPIDFYKGDDSRYIRLADVPGIQQGMSYDVQVRPIMVTGEITEFGEVVTVAIVTAAPDEGGTDNIADIADRGLEAPSDIRVEPKQLSASDRELTVTLGDWISDRDITTLGMIDADGNVIYKREMTLEAGGKVILSAEDLQAGLYTISAMHNREIRTTRLKVNRAGNRDFEVVSDLSIEPRVVDGAGLKATLGGWINEQRMTTFMILNNEGKEVMRSEHMAGAGEPVQLDLTELRNGRYTLQAVNLEGRKSQKFEVARDRGFEAPGSDLHVYPNPIRERDMRLKVGSWIDGSNFTGIRIYDYSGVVKGTMTARLEKGETVRMDVSTLQNGDYNVIVVNGRERRNVRISIRR